MSKCKSCGAEIIWVKMESGKAMPLDAKETLLWKPVREGIAPIQVKGHQSHFAIFLSDPKCLGVDNHGPALRDEYVKQVVYLRKLYMKNQVDKKQAGEQQT